MITCWLYRTIVAPRVDGGPAPPRWARRHVQRCPSCGEIDRALTAVANGLSAGVAVERRPSPPFLHAKIMRAIRAETSLGLELRPKRRNPRVSLAVGSACLVLLAGVIWMYRPHAPFEHDTVAARHAAELSFKVQLPSVAQMNDWTSSLDQPLENETQLVLNDAKTALTSLKNSFLPETTAGPHHQRN